MMCQICGSSQIKKENGVFVCKECGTEYSLEEARGLLVEVEDNASNAAVEKKAEEKTDSPQNKEQLINVLHAWYEYAFSFEKVTSFIYNCLVGEDGNRTNDYSPEAINSLKLKFFPELTPQDFVNKPYDAKVDEKYIRFQFKDRNGNYQRALSPHLALRHYSDAINSEYMNNVCFKMRDELKKFNTYKSENNRDYTKHKTTTTEVVVKSKKTGTIYYQVREDMPLLGTNIMRAITDGVPFEDIEVVVRERINTTEMVAEKRGLFSKPTYRSVEKSTDREYPFQYASLILGYCKKIYDFAKSIMDFQKEQYEYLNSLVPDIKKTFISLLEQKDIYMKMFDLPGKYQTTQAISALAELLYIGRADTWKEAMNLYETDKFQATVLGSLSSINSNLGRINSTLISGFSYLGQKLDMTSQQLDQVINNTSKAVEVGNKIYNGINQIANKDEYINIGIKLDTTVIIK